MLQVLPFPVRTSGCKEYVTVRVSAIQPTAVQATDETHVMPSRYVCVYAPAGSGVACICQLPPFQVSLIPSCVLSVPTATQLVGDTHETPRSCPLLLGGAGVARIFQLDPFHSSASVEYVQICIDGSNASNVHPTAMQNDADTHERLVKVLFAGSTPVGSGFGAE